jgi:hypothetical protein
VHKASQDGSLGMIKEFEDLLEDEEEEVVCAALESAVKLIKLFDVAFHHEKHLCEKHIVPLFAKIINLIEGFSKAKEGSSGIYPNSISVKI